jgi:hypothetical protein
MQKILKYNHAQKWKRGMDGHILTSNNISSPVYTNIINEQMFQQYNNPMVVYYIMFYIQIQTEATNDNLAAMFAKAKEKWRWSVTSDSYFTAYRTNPIIIHIAEIYKNSKLTQYSHGISSIPNFLQTLVFRTYGIIRLEVSVSVPTWSIRYIYYRNLHFLNMIFFLSKLRFSSLRYK